MRRLRGSQGGFTLAELTVAVTLMVVVGAIFGQMLVASSRATTNLQQESDALDDLRFAVTRLDRELRSAECIYEPVAPSLGTAVTGPRLRFTTRSNGGLEEVTYEVAGSTLTRTDDQGSVVLSELMADGSGAFTYLETPRRSVDIALGVRSDGGEPQLVETTMAGRNAWRTC